MSIVFISDFGYFKDGKPNNNFKKNKLEECSLTELVNNIKLKFNEEKDILLCGGDNFYQNGIIFNNKNEYEKKYNHYFKSLIGKKNKIYGLLGNHDYRGNIKYQINNDKLFNIPNMYYCINYENIDIYMIDTILLDAKNSTELNQVYNQYFKPLTKEEINSETKSENLDLLLIKEKYDKSNPKWLENLLFGNPNNIQTENLFKENDLKYDKICKLRLDMLTWLDRELTKSNLNNKKIIVCGHYNILTFGMYKSLNYYSLSALFLLPLFVKHNVKLYISGHDHGTQLHEINNQYIYDLINDFKGPVREIKILNTIIPNNLEIIKNSIDYKLYNVVSGACIDNYEKNKYEPEHTEYEKSIN